MLAASGRWTVGSACRERAGRRPCQSSRHPQLVWLATIWVVRRGLRWARLLATLALLGALAVAGADLTLAEYGRPILPTWLGLVGLLPCGAGLVAVVLLWRRGPER